jgi:ComF family protein
MRQLIHRLKYGGEQQLGRGLGRLLAHHLPAFSNAPTVLMPVPLHRRRLIERGYNQSFELARGVASVTGLPIHPAGIVRQRCTVPQAGLNQSERRANLRNAFRARRALHAAHICLVDDVITTGATGNALAATLLAAGAIRVSLMALARG